LATRRITTLIAVEGEAAYRQAISSCNSELAQHRAALAQVETQFHGNANSMDALTSKSDILTRLYESQKNKVTELTRALDGCREAQGTYANRVTEAKAEIERCESALEALKNETGDTSVEQAKLTEELNKANIELTEAEKCQGAAERGMNKYSREIRVANSELDRIGSELDTCNGHLEEAKKSADGCATSIDNYGNKTKDATESTSELGDLLAAAGIAKLLDEIAAAFASCVTASMEFDATMSGLKAILGASGEEMDILAERARELGRTTVFTAVEIGDAMKYFAVAGAEPEKMLDSLNGIMNLAQGSGLDLARTAEIVADSLEAFGLAAKDTDHFANVLAATTNVANVEVGQLGETLKYVAPSASALGFTIDDVSEAIALMANNGIKAGQAGTTLRSAFSNLVSDKANVVSAMQEYGIEIENQDGSMKSLSEIIDTLRVAFAGMGEAQQMQVASTMFGTQAMSGMLTVIRATEEQIADVSEGIRDADSAFGGMGAAAGMAETATDNLKSKLQIMNNSLEDLKISIGNSFTPILENLADVAAGAFQWISDFIDDNPEIIRALTGVAVALGVLAATFAIYTLVDKLKNSFIAFNAVLMSNPIVLIAAALAGLATVIIMLAAATEEASTEVKEFTAALEASKRAHEELSAEIEQNVRNTQNLIDTLYALVEIEDKTESHKQAILRLVEQLNDALPDLALSYDDVTDSISMTRDAVEEVSSAEQQRLQGEADLDRLTELYQEQTVAANILTYAQERLARAEAELASFDLVNRTNESMREYAQLGEEVRLATDAVNRLEDAQSSLDNQVTALQNSTQAYTRRLAEQRLAEQQAAAAAEQQAAAQAATQAQYEQTESRIMSLTDRIGSLQLAYDESYNAAYSSIDRQLGLFRELDGTAQTSIGNLIGSLESQIEYMNTYAENIQRAMEMGVDQGLVAKLSDGSEESAQILAAIVQGGEEDIAALNAAFAKVDEGKETFASTVAEMETDYANSMTRLVLETNDAIMRMNVREESFLIGTENLRSLISGSQSQRQELINTYTEMAQSALDAYRRVMDQRSPSRKMMESGRNDILGLIMGAEEQKYRLIDVYEDLGNAALEAMERSLPSMITEPSAAERQDRQTAEIVRAISTGRDSRGDTIVNITSPEALDERTAAREFRKAQRDLSLAAS